MCSERKLAEKSSCGERKHKTHGLMRLKFSMKTMYSSKTFKAVNDAIDYVHCVGIGFI